jgi:hypothetical protein
VYLLAHQFAAMSPLGDHDVDECEETAKLLRADPKNSLWLLLLLLGCGGI